MTYFPVKQSCWLIWILALFALVSCDKKTAETTEATGTVVTQSQPAATTHELVSFNEDVMPILSDKCFRCHGPDAKNQKSDFRIDTEELAKKALEDGSYGIVAGDLEQSRVHQLIHSEDDNMMPPPDSNRPLSEEEKNILDAWIAQGAEYAKHWAYLPIPEETPVPEKSGWARNEIDQFVEKLFAKQQLSPAPEVSKEKWLRRVSFDLTGLPPTLEELDAFIADDSTDAYEKVVNRLFETDAYAERMTTEWMDVARYADTYGYQLDRPRFVWPWRDWVISAFKNNLPYKDFITWQLAGDLLPNPTTEKIQATTFNRLHSQKVEGGSVPEEFRMEYVADRLHTFGTAFLGLTMECCRCHDHKYDPLPTKNYYELSSFFANIDESGLYSYFTEATPTPTLQLTTRSQEKTIQQQRRLVQAAEKKCQNLKRSQLPAFKAWLSNKPKTIAWSSLQTHLPFDSFAGGKFPNLAKPNVPSLSSHKNKLVPKGFHGSAVQLTGDDPINVEGVKRYNRASRFSLSLWIKPPKKSERAVIFKQSKASLDAASKGYELLIEKGKLSAALIHFWPGNAMRVRTIEEISPNKWTHIAVSYDGSSRAAGLSIYINGTPAKTEIIRDKLTKEIVKWSGGEQGLVIGQRFRDTGFKNGLVDEFKVFEHTITPIEAKQLWDEKSLQNLLAKAPASLNADEKNNLFDYYLANYSPAMAQASKRLQIARSKLNKTLDATTEIMVMKETPKPKKAYILERGIYDNRREEVTADTPDVLPPFPEGEKKDRLGLSRWLTSDQQPLTARVTVNRYWQMIFSRGIVATPEDFGSQGKRPSHPRLLNWLARDFINHNWDVRHLLKQMVLSSTYRQSTVTTPELREKDPENIYLSRGNAERLSAEMIRDQVLATSGLLMQKVGGPSVKPYELAYSFKPMAPDKGASLYRRSLYTLWQITAPAPVMTTFNSSKRDVCRVKRDVTASPLQALVLLNGPQYIEASRVLGTKMLAQFPAAEDEGQLIDTMFRTLTSRTPESQERDIFLNLYHSQLEYYRKAPAEAAALLTLGNTKKSTAFPDALQAAATALANTMMNLDECVTKR